MLNTFVPSCSQQLEQKMHPDYTSGILQERQEVNPQSDETTNRLFFSHSVEIFLENIILSFSEFKWLLQM